MAESAEIVALTAEIRAEMENVRNARRAGDVEGYLASARHLAHLRDRRVTLRAAAMRGIYAEDSPTRAMDEADAEQDARDHQFDWSEDDRYAQTGE